MKVLFVCSGSPIFGIPPIVKNQGESLKKLGVDLDFYTIEGRGIKSYLKSIENLKKFLRKGDYDLLHAHYAFTGWVSFFARPGIPIIVSYMGCDTYGDYDASGRLIPKTYLHILMGKFLQPFINVIIVKSKNLAKYIYQKKKLNIVPNGVDFEKYKPMDQIEARKYLGLESDSKYALFLGEKNNLRKNYPLFEQAVTNYTNGISPLNPYPVKQEDIAYYLNAADVLVSTSFNEGSPNVIKEAMACNCPIISTDVGDIAEVISDTENCYLCDFDAEDTGKKINNAISRGIRTNGRKNISHLRSEVVAKKIISIYEKTLKKYGYNR